jgi:hypothetical protein
MPWVCRYSIDYSRRDEAAENKATSQDCLLDEVTVGQAVRRLIDCPQNGVQSRSGKLAMVRAIRQWLETNELFAIVTAVVCTLVLLSLILVLGSYLIVTGF